MELKRLRFFLEKKGVFFSADALMAILIIFVVVLLTFPIASRVKPDSRIGADILNSLSAIKFSEIDDPYAQVLISSGSINETNKTVLEQIGEFYVTDVDLAKNLAASVMSDVETNENFGIWYGSTLIYSKNKTSYESAEEVDVERKIISGLQSGESVTGFSDRAFLTNSLRNKFFYFGGYVGDGNISVRVDYNGTIENAQMELVINDDFQFYVNNISQGVYSGSPDEFTPVKYNLSILDFHSGANTLEFKGENLHIAGGFLKISYAGSVVFNSTENKYYLPGVDGFVNLYDGFYVPGNLNGIEIFLHLNSNQTKIFLNLGNETLFNNTTNGTESFLINNSQISSALDYASLSNKTIPLRLGIANASYEFSPNVDIFSVTDLSASMHCDVSCSGSYSSPIACNLCGGTWDSPINAAKAANNQLIDDILNYSGNRVGLSAFSRAGEENNPLRHYYHPLSNDSGSLKSNVSWWSPFGGTCICCGINKAISGFANSTTDFKAMVVMSDGTATEQCAEQGTGSASQDAINAACEAYEEHGIIVHAVGFGNVAEEGTLQAIASCGHGFYYFSDVSELSEIYHQIAQSIIASYIDQTVELLGGARTKLYSDSYISFSNSPTTNPFGLVVTVEKNFDNSSAGQFLVPSDSSILEARVASYSGPRWTDRVKINGQDFYNLADYGNEYIGLGDPYNFLIPKQSVENGTNSVEVMTGISPENSSEGSINNKVIYTLLKSAISFTGLKTVARGCVWEIEFESGGSLQFSVPPDYSGTDVCIFNQTQSEFDLPSSGNDAAQVAVYELLKELDIDGDGKIDVTFTQQDLQISLDEIVGIPFTWSTEVQVRRWLP